MHDLALAASLARSSKDLEEHEYAVRSVAEALAPHCTSMNVPETPFVLHLPNVMHLATDVTGVVSDDATVLGLAEALHPTAAVCGTPTEAALGRHPGHRGAGPRALRRSGRLVRRRRRRRARASRCAAPRSTAPSMRLFAGCGIVAGSDPEAELAEAQAKFVAMRDALGLSRPPGSGRADDRHRVEHEHRAPLPG